MAQQFYSLDLQTTQFPMLSRQQARTVINNSVGEAKGSARPYVAYAHNVMPSKYGFDSISYLQGPLAPAVPKEPFLDARIVYAEDRSRLYMAWDAEGNIFYLTDPPSAQWTPVPDTTPSTVGPGFDSNSVTVATVNGVSYIYYSTIGCFTFDSATHTMTPVALPALTVSLVLGMVASSGYLIAYTAESIAWSSTIDPTDFAPSQVTGAGGGNVAGIAGDIIFVTSNSLGIVAYSVANAIAGTYTGNVQYPFKFREISGSAGGLSLDLVAYEATAKDQFIFSKAGLQVISSTQAETILPEVTDFLTGRVFEDYNETTKLYEYTDIALTATMLRKVKYIASRYLIISYGVTSFTHAIVFDTALQKVGKFKVPHVDVFEYVGSQAEIVKESITFLQADGNCLFVDFPTLDITSNGVIIFGKLEISHARMLTLLGVQLENITGVATTTAVVSDQSSLDGRNFVVVPSNSTIATQNQREYTFRNTAKNHSIAIQGNFNLTSVIVRYLIASRR